MILNLGRYTEVIMGRSVPPEMIDLGILMTEKNANSLSSSFIIVSPNIPVDARWMQNGTTVAGGNGPGNASDQVWFPNGLFVDGDRTMIIGEWENHRVTLWKMGDTNGEVVAGGHGPGNQSDQFYFPTDVLIDIDGDSFIICDVGNQRVVQWSRRSGTTQGEILVNNINCYGLAVDDQKYLYVSDYVKHEVRRYEKGDKDGTIVAGGNGAGTNLNQFNAPGYIFVDRQQTVYVSDYRNHRVMKWNKGASEGRVVAGGNGQGSNLTQLSYPNGLSIDTLGTVYVVDSRNNRVMRWPTYAKQGTIIAGGNGQGSEASQFYNPEGLSFDRQGNLYVADVRNNRIQSFSIE
ncbi:unnamed protein product [Adineta ricciae]|uniref:Uncharacterized protein n=1 Tax=Adineta ricciae TaxID=249248 RepID=A0A813U762_ADIRI|nr:unnamed protein product [Adineta ricciae]